MATTMFFEEVLTNAQPHDKAPEFDFEFGRSSYYGESLVYFVIDGKTVILSEAQGRRVCKAMADLGAYLCYD